MNFFNQFKKIAEKKFTQDSIRTIFSHFFVGISGLIINTIIGSFYYVDGLGLFNQALAIYMLVTLIGNFGIQTSAQKHSSQFLGNQFQLKKIFTSIVFSTLITSLLISFLFYSSLYFFPLWLSSKELKELVVYFIFSCPIFAVNKSINNFNAGIRKINLYSNIKILRWASIIIGISGMVILSIPLKKIGLIFFIVESAIFFYLMFILNKFLSVNFDLSWICIHIKFGIKSVFAEFVATFNSRMPIFIIGYFLGNKSAGYYSFIEIFGRSILLISGAIQKNFNSVFSTLWYKNEISEISEKIGKVIKFSSYSLIPLLLFNFTFFTVYTSLFMSPDYLQYKQVLAVFYIGISFMYLFGPVFTLLIMSGHLYWNLIRVIIFGFTNLIFTTLYIHKYGLIGASIGYSISVIINLILLIWLNKYVLNIDLAKITFYNFNLRENKI